MLLSGGLQRLLSFLLTLSLFLCILAATQSERIDEVARWLEAEPQTRARLLAALLEKSAIVERASIATIETTFDAQKQRNKSPHKSLWIVSDASFLLASGIEARFRSLTWEGAKALASIARTPRGLRVEGLRIVVPIEEQGWANAEQQEDATTKTKQNKRKRRSQKRSAWHAQVQQLGFVSSLAGAHRLTLQDSAFLFQRAGKPLLRLRFKEIVADNRNGIAWRGRGIAESGRGAASRQSVIIRGSYASVSEKLYQSIRVENWSPQEMLQTLTSQIDNKKFAEEEKNNNAETPREKKRETKKETKATHRWLARKGQVSIDYRLDMRKRQSWLRARFAQSNSALEKNPTLSFDRSLDDRRRKLTNTGITFRALPLDILHQISDWLTHNIKSMDLAIPKPIPFQMSGIASGTLSMQEQQKEPKRFLGNISIEKLRFRWNKNDKSAVARRLTLGIDGNDESLQIATSIDFDSAQRSGQASGIDNNITLLPYEESVTQQETLFERSGLRIEERKTWNPSKFRIVLEGASRGNMPVQTVYALWPPRFKSKVRETVVEVAKEGEAKDLTFALDVVVDLKAKTERLDHLQGRFLLQKARLQLFAKPATFTDIRTTARFTKREIIFNVAQARYGDFRLEEGEVLFERQTLPNNEKHTLMRIGVFGEGAAEPLRRFVLGAPFLQEIEALQRTARWLPKAPSAQVKGHFNLSAFIEQLNIEQLNYNESETIFPYPFSYDTAFQVEKIRLQAPFLRFYEGSATLASTSQVPLDLALRMKSDRGANLQGRWRIVLPDEKAVRQRQEVQRLTLTGVLDAKALANDFAYLPQEWFQKNMPAKLIYQEKTGAATKGILTVDFPRSRLRLESLEPLKGAPVSLSGSLKTSNTQKEKQTQDPAWKMAGRIRWQGKTSFVIERGGAEKKTKPFILSLENLPKPKSKLKSKLKSKPKSIKEPAQKTPAEWLLTLEAEDLDMSRWIAQKPWLSLMQESREKNDNPPALRWGERVNLTFDARLKKLRLQKTDARHADADLLEQAHASLRWQEAKIHKASFLTHGGIFVLSQKKRRKKKKRGGRTQVFYALREGKEFFSAKSDDLGSFLHQVFGKNFAEGGKAQISFVRAYRPEQRPKPHLEGYAEIKNISLYQLPLLLKIFDAVDFVSAFRKGIRKLDMKTDLRMWDGILTLKEFRLANNLTALSANGSLDLKEQKLDLRGEIASLHLVSKILRNIPLIGAIIVGRKRHNLFAFSYEAKGEWDNPQVTASPLNILLPGIIKIANPLQLLERDEIKKAQEQRRQKIADEQQKKHHPRKHHPRKHHPRKHHDHSRPTTRKRCKLEKSGGFADQSAVRFLTDREHRLFLGFQKQPRLFVADNLAVLSHAALAEQPPCCAVTFDQSHFPEKLVDKTTVLEDD